MLLGVGIGWWLSPRSAPQQADALVLGERLLVPRLAEHHLGLAATTDASRRLALLRGMARDLAAEAQRRAQQRWGDDLPVLAGLSATYLYKSKRELAGSDGESIFDDLRGKPMGHFVVLCGMERKQVRVADPYQDNPYSKDLYYHVPVGRLINSIMLGIVTYDANLLIISPDPLP